jgi:hypothetical protein
MTNVNLETIYWVKTTGGFHILSIDKKGNIPKVELDVSLFGERNPSKDDYYCREEGKVIFKEDFDPNGIYRVIS